MTSLNSLEKELKLRKLFTTLIKKKGYVQDIFYSDLFGFFDICQTVSLKEIKTFWKKRIAEVGRDGPRMYLYVHIPFCRRECNYCFFPKRIDIGESQMEQYVQFVIREMQSFKKSFKNVQFGSLYLGGGTPSLLTRKQLCLIFQTINAGFAFDENAERTFECNPADFSLEKMKLLEGFGINRISFGIQSLDPEVLRHANRGYQDHDMIKKIVGDMRRFPGLERINADLLIGLWNDTPQTVIDSFVKLAELKFDSICLFPLKPIPRYLKRYFNNNRDLFDRQLVDKLHSFEKSVIPVAQKFGYSFTPLDYSAPDKLSWDFVKKTCLSPGQKKLGYVTDDIPYDCLGIGKGCWSMISHTVCYKNKSLLSFTEEKNKPRESYCAIPLSGPREKFWYVLQRLGDIDRISLPLYKDWFGTDIRADFKVPLAKLQELGAIKFTDDVIFLTVKSLEDKFAHLLFFVDNKTILTEIDKLNAKSWPGNDQ